MATKTKTDIELKEEIKGYVISAFPNACKDCGADLTGEVLFEQATAYILQACTKELTERFNSYLDERIVDCESTPPLSENHKRLLEGRWATLHWVKQNFERIVKEIANES